MRWLVRGVLVLALLGFVGVAVLVAGSLLSLDWDREHTAAAAALPLASAGWVTEEALERQRSLVTGPYEEIEVEAGHFVMREQPEEVIEKVLGRIEGT